MKATGMVRKVDDLGRIVVPIELRRNLGISVGELRRNLGISVGDPVEFYVDGRTIIVKKYDATGSVAELVDRLEQEIRMKSHLLTTKQVAALDEKLQELKEIVKEQGANEDT